MYTKILYTSCKWLYMELIKYIQPVFRPIQGIGGFTREAVVALTTNIESQV